MWYPVFSQVLHMSMIGSVVILSVLLARQLLKRAPKFLSYALWGIVLFRLLCPVAPASALSLMNLLPAQWQSDSFVAAEPSDMVLDTISRQEADQALQSNPEYILAPHMETRPVLSESIPYVEYDISGPLSNRVSALTTVIQLGMTLWLTGILILLSYSFRSLWKLRRQLDSAIPLRDNIYLADHITTPFVLGLLRPRIYLPSSLSEESQSYILLHEQHHIQRLDHMWKLLAFLALCLHWFNPLVWIAFILAGKDMEMSCDEAVLRRMGDSIRADYSASLLTLSTGQRIYAAMPLAFGEGDTKDRIRHVLSWKKPRTWILIAAVIVCLILLVSLSTDPHRQSDFFGARYSVKEVLYDAPQYNFTVTADTAPEFTITSDHVLLWRLRSDADDQWQNINGLTKVDYSRQELYALFDPLYCTAHERLDQVKQIYRAEPINISASTFFLVMQTKKGDVLLAMGHGTGENEHVRWLFLLEQQSGSYDLNHMNQTLKDKYGKDTEYFSLYQCDTQPDTILLGFQVGTGTAKGPSSVGYAVFRYDQSMDDYLLHHSQILRYQATGLYPVKLTQEDGYDASLQLILSTRDDLAAVELTSPLKDQADFKLSQSVIGAGGPSMLVFACPDDLMLNTMNIQYLYDWNNTPNTNPLAPELGHYGLTTDTDSDPSHASFVSLNLQEDNVFTFTYDPLSSYFNYGHYTIQGDRLIAVTDDGRHQYCFQILGKYTLRFLQDQSSEVSLIDERFGSAVTDGALFQHPLYYFGGNIN